MDHYKIMNYPDGTQICIGDHIWWNEGSCVGRVAMILEEAEDYSEWGLDEPGIFICTAPEGESLTCDIYNRASQFKDEGIIKISEDILHRIRGEQNARRNE